MTVYLDTSHLVKLYVEEDDSGTVEALVQMADIVATSALAYPEARATFARRRRERLMSPSEHTRVVRQLDADWDRLLILPLSAEGAQAAGRLADRHRLRGADAVHLVAFEELLSHSEDADVRFSCADSTLTRAARSLA